jgi:hypothetical protein
MYYEFSEKYPYEEKFPDLLKEVAKYFHSGSTMVSLYVSRDRLSGHGTSLLKMARSYQDMVLHAINRLAGHATSLLKMARSYQDMVT